MPGISKGDDGMKALRSRLQALTEEQRADLNRCLFAEKTSGHSLVAEAAEVRPAPERTTASGCVLIYKSYLRQLKQGEDPAEEGSAASARRS